MLSETTCRGRRGGGGWGNRGGEKECRNLLLLAGHLFIWGSPFLPRSFPSSFAFPKPLPPTSTSPSSSSPSLLLFPSSFPHLPSQWSVSCLQHQQVQNLPRLSSSFLRFPRPSSIPSLP